MRADAIVRIVDLAEAVVFNNKTKNIMVVAVIATVTVVEVVITIVTAMIDTKAMVDVMEAANTQAVNILITMTENIIITKRTAIVT